MIPSRPFVRAFALALASWLAACGDDGSLRNRGVGAVCAVNDDCASGLVCELGDEISTCQPRDAAVLTDAAR